MKHLNVAAALIGTSIKLNATNNRKALDCKIRSLAHEFSSNAIGPSSEVWEALELGRTCGLTPPEVDVSVHNSNEYQMRLTDSDLIVFVDGNGDDSNDGSKDSPVQTIERAVAVRRRASEASELFDHQQKPL